MPPHRTSAAPSQPRLHRARGPGARNTSPHLTGAAPSRHPGGRQDVPAARGRSAPSWCGTIAAPEGVTDQCACSPRRSRTVPVRHHHGDHGSGQPSRSAGSSTSLRRGTITAPGRPGPRPPRSGSSALTGAAPSQLVRVEHVSDLGDDPLRLSGAAPSPQVLLLRAGHHVDGPSARQCCIITARWPGGAEPSGRAVLPRLSSAAPSQLPVPATVARQKRKFLRTSPVRLHRSAERLRVRSFGWWSCRTVPVRHHRRLTAPAGTVQFDTGASARH